MNKDDYIILQYRSDYEHLSFSGCRESIVSSDSFSSSRMSTIDNDDGNEDSINDIDDTFSVPNSCQVSGNIQLISNNY